MKIDVQNATWLVVFSVLSLLWLGVAVAWLFSTSASLRRMADAMESFVKLQLIEAELHDEIDPDLDADAAPDPH